MMMMHPHDDDASSHSHNKKILRAKPKRLERSKRDSIRFDSIPHPSSWLGCVPSLYHACEMERQAVGRE